MHIPSYIDAMEIPFQIHLPNGTALNRFVYAYLLLQKEVILIDTGVAGAERHILDRLKKRGKSLESIASILLTHAHPDHIGAARAIREIASCHIGAHPADAAWISDTTLQCRERPVPGFDRLVGGAVPVDYLLEEGLTFALGFDGRTIRVLHTPGHSPGSISLFIPQDGILFSGDAIPRPGDLPIYDDYQASCASLDRLYQLDGVEVLFSSWDRPRGGPDAREAIARGRDYLCQIHQAVLASVRETQERDPLRLCPPVLERLGLTGIAPNPLLARTLAGHLRAL